MNNLKEFVDASCPTYLNILHDDGAIKALQYVFREAVDNGRVDLLEVITEAIKLELSMIKK